MHDDELNPISKDFFTKQLDADKLPTKSLKRAEPCTKCKKRLTQHKSGICFNCNSGVKAVY